MIQPFYRDNVATIYCCSALEAMCNMPDNSIDAIVTDPPYELGLLGKKWDKSGIAYNIDMWREALRILKPGSHLLAFGGTRTYHRMVCAIEDAGFEIRDMLEWIYKNGFPKNVNISKAIDQAAGVKRKIIGSKVGLPIYSLKPNDTNNHDRKVYGKYTNVNSECTITAQATKLAKQWEGFGTALKPAHEPIVLARKPLSEKTIIKNCIKYGTGALDIDGCRIPTSDTPSKWFDEKTRKNPGFKLTPEKNNEITSKPHNLGRFPANICVSQDALNDGEITKSTRIEKPCMYDKKTNIFVGTFQRNRGSRGYNDSGSKSRYFDIEAWAENRGLIQIPKASKKEKNTGFEESNTKNNHPTVKPIHLMLWLVRLVSKKNDTILDPFCGSGTAGCAAKILGRKAILIELEKQYCEIAAKRIAFQEQPKALNEIKPIAKKKFKDFKNGIVL